MIPQRLQKIEANQGSKQRSGQERGRIKEHVFDMHAGSWSSYKKDFSECFIRFGWQMVVAGCRIPSHSLNGRRLSLSQSCSVSHCEIIFIVSLRARKTETFQSTFYDDIPPELLLLPTRLGCGYPVPHRSHKICHNAPDWVSRRLPIAISPHTDFWDDPPPSLPLAIVLNIIYSCCSWERCDASSCWSRSFMNRSRCFLRRSQLDLCRAKSSRYEPEPISLGSNAVIPAVIRSGLSSLLQKCHCFPGKKQKNKKKHREDEDERTCHTPE